MHRAAQGETSGWHIDYVDADGEQQLVELQGTMAAAFTGVELTAQEMRAAKARGGRSRLPTH